MQQWWPSLPVQSKRSSTVKSTSTNSMYKAKQYYLECLKKGINRHDYISKTMKKDFGVVPSEVRDALIDSGHIIQKGQIVRGDNKKVNTYILTGKPLKAEPKEYSPFWEDGTPKSRGNAFDWQNFAVGLYTQSELAATEAGRKFGMAAASRQILPRVFI